MNAAWICLGGLAIFALGYRFYSRFLATRVFDLRDDEEVPAHAKRDDVDFAPAERHVLLGHHYASIAGAAPIIGPAIAVIWGWVPAVIWIVFGTVFLGAVHDFSTLVLSIRNGGESVGQITARVLGPRTRSLFLMVIFVLIFVVIAVFAKAIATLFVKFPGTVLPINFEIIAALAMGWVCARSGWKLLWPSIAALVALYGMVAVGTYVPLPMPDVFGVSGVTVWVVLLLAYAFVASVLPVWVLLQPRDLINSHQLVVGLGALILGLMIAQPELTAPAFNSAPEGAPAIFPFLFVTIACGAISGFHGLVSSGTTSKQLDRATDARPVGYGAMLGEGVLALIATLAVSAGLADWAGHYHSWGAAAKGGISAFVQGASTFLGGLGLPSGPAQVLVAVLVISFAATSLDTGVRIQRYILQELGSIYGVKPLGNRYVAAAIAVGGPLVLVLLEQERALWPLFGATNQLLAGLSLLLVAVWLYRDNKTVWPVAIPAVLVLAITVLAMTSNLITYVQNQQYMLLGVGAVILVLELWVVLEGLLAIRRIRSER